MENRMTFRDGQNVELYRMTEDPRSCSYLPGKTATLEYRLIARAAKETCQKLILRGWRRFGISFFRPACENCVECQSLRVAVDRFRPSKSQRRCIKQNQDVTTVIQRPGISREHIRLYNAYHAEMHRRRGWPDRPIAAGDYFESFVAGAGSFGHEVLYFSDGRLVGVGLIDILPAAVSSIYFYHDPAWRRRGPGTFSILREIQLAKQIGKPYLYLGYYVRENGSMSYKSRFTPHDILDAYVNDETSPSWRSPMSPPPA